MITDNLNNFIDKTLTQLQQLNIDVTNLELDHFGYQTSSKDDYESKKTESQQIGKMASENIVGGRRVCIIRLLKQHLYGNFEISGIEIIEPKDEQVCLSSLDHLEFVLKESFENFINKYKTVSWDTTALERPEFAKLSLRFGDGSGVKFHLKNIFDEIPQ